MQNAVDFDIFSAKVIEKVAEDGHRQRSPARWSSSRHCKSAVPQDFPYFSLP
jgi:hypothetical protein